MLLLLPFMACYLQLLLSLSVKVDKCIYKIGNAGADVEEVHKLVVKVEVEEIWHLDRKFFVLTWSTTKRLENRLKLHLREGNED